MFRSASHLRGYSDLVNTYPSSMMLSWSWAGFNHISQRSLRHGVLQNAIEIITNHHLCPDKSSQRCFWLLLVLERIDNLVMMQPWVQSTKDWDWGVLLTCSLYIEQAAQFNYWWYLNATVSDTRHGWAETIGVDVVFLILTSMSYKLVLTLVDDAPCKAKWLPFLFRLLRRSKNKTAFSFVKWKRLKDLQQCAAEPWPRHIPYLLRITVELFFFKRLLTAEKEWPIWLNLMHYFSASQSLYIILHCNELLEVLLKKFGEARTEGDTGVVGKGSGCIHLPKNVHSKPEVLLCSQKFFMRFAKAGPRRKHAIVVVGVFVFTVFLLFIQSQRAGWVTKLPTIACIGSESNIVERSEDYVKKFAKKLSKEARNLERANEVYSHHPIWSRSFPGNMALTEASSTNAWRDQHQ